MKNPDALMHKDAGEVHRKRADDASDLAGYRATGVSPPEEFPAKGGPSPGDAVGAKRPDAISWEVVRAGPVWGAPDVGSGWK